MVIKTYSRELVSVVMPVFNCAQFVDEAIESIVKQTYANIEIYIIDDCSTDGTRERIETWAKLDRRIKPIYKGENSGIVESLNLGIKLSNGEYIARMDGDDISLPQRIEKQVQFMNANLEIGVLGCGYRVLGKNKIFTPLVEHDLIKIGLLIESQLAHPTVMFRASVLRNLDRFYNPKFTTAQDYEFWVFLSSKTKLGNLPDVLLEYRVHGGNISKNNIKTLKFNKEIHEYQMKRLGLNIDEINTIKLKNIFNSKNNLNNLVLMIQKLTIFRKIIVNNRKSQIYNIKYFESLIFGGIQMQKLTNPIYQFIYSIFLPFLLKYSFKNRNFSLKIK
jgi:glycosyltransferase involved in cell wall biosynthesis